MTTITHTADGPRFDGMTVGELIASLDREATILEAANEEGVPYIRSIIAALRHLSAQRPAPAVDTDLDALEAAARAATPGPWEHLADRGIISTVSTATEPKIGLAICYGPNAAYIAAANPAAVLALIDEVHRLRAAVARVRGE